MIIAYKVSSIFNAIQNATINLPGFACDEDKSGNKQAYQIILCGKTAGTRIEDALAP
jgi:hypothetical protein